MLFKFQSLPLKTQPSLTSLISLLFITMFMTLFFAVSEIEAQSVNVLETESISAPSQYNPVVSGTGAAFYLKNTSFFENTSDEPRYSNVQHFSASPDRFKIGMLSLDEVLTRITLDAAGSLVSESKIPYYGDDPSLRIYTFDDGHSIVRENISSFSFYDPAGNLLYPLSNSSGSKDGEAFSELASNPSGETVVIYNPSIRRADGSSSSRASLLNRSNKSLESFFSAPNKQIYSVNITETGTFFTLVAGANGEDSEVHVYDRFGNLLLKNEVDFDATNATYFPEENRLLAYSSSRAAVYNTVNGSRLGSSSVRETIIGAHYFSDDSVILILTGKKQDNVIDEPAFVAVDVNQRKIAKGSFGKKLLLISSSPIFSRVSGNTYKVDGVGVPLNISVRF